MIAVVDMGISNIGSVMRALERVGAPRTEKATAENLGDATAVLLPGVGAFGDGMASLVRQGLTAKLRQVAAMGTPIFGICLGMQLLADSSEEHGHHAGLGLIGGRVIPLQATQPGDRVPNIGWSDVTPTRKSTLFPSGAGGSFYHVHSFRLAPTDPSMVAATISFSGDDIPVAVEQGNLFGVQFHAEKSQDDGLDLLAAFLSHLRRLGGIA
jgi:glutamine amidotransferase